MRPTVLNVLVIRIEQAALCLGMVAKDADDLDMLTVAVKARALIEELEALVVEADPVLRCEHNPSECDGCADGACFN